MSRPPVLLVAMPWDALEFPSIQLGTLQAVLARADIPTEVRSFKLAFMEHCLAATADRAPEERIGLADYQRVAREMSGFALGDWIFAVPPFRDDPDLDPSYLGYLRERGVPEADIAKALGMRALVPGFLERCVDELLAAGPAIVGFSTVFSQNVPSLVLAKLLKARVPSLWIVFGGANCDGPMGAALHRAFPWVDVVVRGEAERVLPELVKDLLAGGPVRPQPGICYREGSRSVMIEQAGEPTISMDEVPTPVYDEYFQRLAQASFRAELLPEVAISYETARGCWWGAKSHCAFCGLNGSTMAFRSKSPDRVMAEIAALAGRYGRLDFRVVDNIMDLRYLSELLPRLRDSSQDFRFFCEVKANLAKEQVRLLREAGVDGIEPGIESLSTPILRLMRKGVTAFQNVRLLKWCAEFGVRVRWNVIYGTPEEPPGEYPRMADGMRGLTHLDPPELVPLVVQRFSPYHARPGEFGLEVLGPLDYYRLLYPTDPATLADLAYCFDYRYVDGRDPETYVGPVRDVVATWSASRPAGFRSLRYRRGPGFLVVTDRRPGLEAAEYSFEEAEARIYLACENGATASEAWQAIHAGGRDGLAADDVREFLDGLVEQRLVYEECGRYLALALPGRLPEEP